jgi:hypothetical protein
MSYRYGSNWRPNDGKPLATSGDAVVHLEAIKSTLGTDRRVARVGPTTPKRVRDLRSWEELLALVSVRNV